MQDPAGAGKILKEFAELGARLSIDDFGTGYSSLAYLRMLPIHALKIDRAFVVDMSRGEQDAVIVRSIIGLAHNLGLQVIAEGVEDAETLLLLGQLQCDLAQGYHLGRPQPAAELEKLIRESAGK
jgi:EAL domain-containing protein (putative c-di-GMP-specific phosphodiesterase class I)